jgi:hypothetical protein
MLIERNLSRAILLFAAAALLGLVASVRVLGQPVAGPPVPVPVPVPVPAAPAAASGGLKLPADQTVEAGSQFIEIEAQTKATEVVFDTFSVFADEKVVLKTRQNGRVLTVGIPASAGAIRIVAVALVDGKLAKAVTVVTVEAKSQPPVTPPPPPRGDGLPAVAPGIPLHLTFVGAEPSAALRKALEAGGVKVHAFPDAAKAPAGFAAAAGAVPGLVLQDGAGKALAAQKLPADVEVVALINRSRGGK